jgi:hypothetical protein
MFILVVDWGIGLEFPIYPIGDETLQLRCVVSSSTVGPLPELNSYSTQKQNCETSDTHHFQHMHVFLILTLCSPLMEPGEGIVEGDVSLLQTILPV